MGHVQLDCEPCIARTSYTIKAILHGASDDEFWQKLAASARQAAGDMRVTLDLELYPPGGYSEKRMANDIRRAASSAPGDDGIKIINALLVTIPSEVVADAVRFAAEKGMPVFGLNSGYEEVSGPDGLMRDGSVLFFTAMNERKGGEDAADYFLRGFEKKLDNNNTTVVDDVDDSDDIFTPTAATSGLNDADEFAQDQINVTNSTGDDEDEYVSSGGTSNNLTTDTDSNATLNEVILDINNSSSVGVENGLDISETDPSFVDEGDNNLTSDIDNNTTSLGSLDDTVTEENDILSQTQPQINSTDSTGENDGYDYSFPVNNNTTSLGSLDDTVTEENDIILIPAQPQINATDSTGENDGYDYSFPVNSINFPDAGGTTNLTKDIDNDATPNVTSNINNSSSSVEVEVEDGLNLSETDSAVIVEGDDNSTTGDDIGSMGNSSLVGVEDGLNISHSDPAGVVEGGDNSSTETGENTTSLGNPDIDPDAVDITTVNATGENDIDILPEDQVNTTNSTEDNVTNFPDAGGAASLATDTDNSLQDEDSLLISESDTAVVDGGDNSATTTGDDNDGGINTSLDKSANDANGENSTNEKDNTSDVEDGNDQVRVRVRAHDSDSISLTMGKNATRRKLLYQGYTHALFVTPLGEMNSAFQQRHDGYRDRLIEATNHTGGPPIEVDLFEFDASTAETIDEGLSEILSGCKYQSVLVASGRFAAAVAKAIRANGCDSIENPTKMGTFDTSTEISDLIASKKTEFAIDQHNHMQGWTPVHFAALYVSTGMVVAPPPEEVYLSGPALFSRENAVSDTLRKCADESFPVCPTGGSSSEGGGMLKSSCPCTDRKKVVVGGVVHGITTDEFWDTVFGAAEQAADDMGIELDFHRFEPQASPEVLHRKMSAKILSLCQGGVDGLFVTISSSIVVDAVKRCTELDVPVMSINAGFAESKELNLIHHVGMVEEDGGHDVGYKLASMATFEKAFCLNHVPGLAVMDDRCRGFGKAMEELGIEYAEVGVPDDNIARYKAIVEAAVGETGDWDGIGILVGGVTQLPAALELLKLHPNFVMGSFDTSSLLYQALEDGTVLFGIDQQSYLQGYLPIPILTHAATTKQFLLDHSIKSGPSFVLASPYPEEAICIADNFPVCPEHPEETFNYITDGLIALGYIFFALQALATVLAIAWMAYYRRKTVVKASQPEFLALVVIGCLVVASAILPLSIEGGYRFERDAITLEETDKKNDQIKGVDAACMAVPWLICIGFVLMYSALVAKLRRVREVVKNGQHFRRVQVKKSSVAFTIGSLLAAISTILLTWQLVSPLRWERIVIETDYVTGYPTGSVGSCTSEHSAAFAGACACFIGFSLAYALVLCYKTRDMPIEFSESKYIAASVFYLLQLLVLGVPILVIARENTNASFIVISLILFLMSFGTTLLIFVPKIMANTKRGREQSSLEIASAMLSRRDLGGHGRRESTVQELQRRIAERPQVVAHLSTVAEDEEAEPILPNGQKITSEEDAMSQDPESVGEMKS